MARKSKYLPLGTQISVRAILRRTEESYGTPGRRWHKVWTRTPVALSGVIAGVRTLSEGDTEYIEDAGCVYDADNHFSAYLIAFHLRRKLVFARIEDVKPSLTTGRSPSSQD